MSRSPETFPMRPSPALRILRVDSSARTGSSVSRRLGDLLLHRLEQEHGSVEIAHRDVSAGLPFVTEAWVVANATDPAERTPQQEEELAVSERLVGELERADVLVLSTPIYNFGIPAALKAWIDQVARARRTFRYSDAGPVGLLEGKKAYVLVASGGTEVGSEIDFVSGYLRHILGFLGIRDVELIAADRLMARGDEALAGAVEAMDHLFAGREQRA